ncbi:MAG: sigma-70 family RNA polymerase sigma factor [Pseudomonadota bacterium]|nr:sigma-70 family RNA polymerase sigma factor [Pseudomonadota bacterium]
MLRFASLQLPDPGLAEDAVQEALSGALRNTRDFKGHSELTTWVFAILRNKIADTWRQRRRLVYASSLASELDAEGAAPALAEDGAGPEAFFGSSGSWYADERPATWGNPQDALRESQFWNVLEGCLEGLPENQARAFMMREFLELDTAEICSNLGITPGNLNVILHRARLRLRKCLEHRWFAKGELSC